MNRIILFSLLCLYAFFVSAQEAEQLYNRNDSIVKQIAEKYAKQNAGGDSIKMASLKQAIQESFYNYWKKAKTSFRISALNKLALNREQLQSEVNSLAKLVNSRKQEKPKADATALKNQLEKATIEANNAEAEKLRLETTLLSLKESVAEAEKRIEDFNESGNTIIALQSSIAEAVNQAYKRCGGSIEEALPQEMDEAINAFENNKESLQPIMEGKEFTDLVKKVSKIKQFKPFFDKVKEAIAQMKNDFDEKTNTSLVTELNSLSKKISLTKDQQAEKSKLVKALQLQSRAYRNLNAIINDIKDENGERKIEDIIKDAFDLTVPDILENIKGTQCYSHYYEKINSILSDIRNNAGKKKGESLTRYLDNLRF